MASSFAPRSTHLSSTSSGHRSFRLTRPDKEKLIGRTMPHGYISQPVKKELASIEKQIVHAVGRGDKTFTDEHGVKHTITDEMRFFAKEAQQGGHTLTRRSEVSRFAKGEVEVNREFDIQMKSGYNIGSEREVAGKIVKAEEEGLESHNHHGQLSRQERRQHRDEMRSRLGLPVNSAAASFGAPPTPATQEVQPLGTPAAPAHPPSHPANLLSPGITAGRRTATQDTSDEPTIVAPLQDPISEENQAVADSVPPAKDVDLPDTTNVDRGLPF